MTAAPSDSPAAIRRPQSHRPRCRGRRVAVSFERDRRRRTTAPTTSAANAALDSAARIGKSNAVELPDASSSLASWYPAATASTVTTTSQRSAGASAFITLDRAGCADAAATAQTTNIRHTTHGKVPMTASRAVSRADGDTDPAPAARSAPMSTANQVTTPPITIAGHCSTTPSRPRRSGCMPCDSSSCTSRRRRIASNHTPAATTRAQISWIATAIESMSGRSAEAVSADRSTKLVTPDASRSGAMPASFVSAPMSSKGSRARAASLVSAPDADWPRSKVYGPSHSVSQVTRSVSPMAAAVSTTPPTPEISNGATASAELGELGSSVDTACQSNVDETGRPAASVR